jgi:N-acetylglutamate synthase-like GNAT family acetyltransferase
MSKTMLQLPDNCRLVSGPSSGEPIRIARLGRADYDAILAMLRRCSKVTLQLRFHAVTNGVSYVTRLLGEATNEIGYGAWLASRCVGLASLHVTDGTSAEMAVLVEDDWQQHGVGSALVAELARHAREQGLSSLRADVHADNHFIPPALARIGPIRTSISFGVRTIWLKLDEPQANIEGAAA